jgi:aspartate/methionine/tyrosine aminotransferase
VRNAALSDAGGVPGSSPAARPPRAARLSALGLSPIRAMSSDAPEGCVSLGLGEPSWALPEAARRALSGGEGPCSYGPNSGLPGLRSAIASFYGIAGERVMVSSGSQGALFALFMAYLGPGDEALVPDPGFLAYPSLARLAGAEPAPYPLAPDGSLDERAFASVLAAHPRAAAAVINHPANPTGAGASEAALASVAAACEERGILLVSDEVYRELYLGPRPPSLAEVSEYGIVTGSVSKAWGAPGLRVGWALGDPEVLEAARLVHSSMVSCVPRPSQEAARALLEDSDSILPASRAELKLRWEALARSLEAELGIEPEPPAGAFYYWLPLPCRSGDDARFCLRLRDEGKVILIPGGAFGSRGSGYARLSFAASPEELREGLRRLAPFWRKS